MPSTPTNIKARQITDADVPEVVNLLTHGFGTTRTHEFWRQALAYLSTRPVPDGFPRYGFVLEGDGKLAGVLLMIFATLWEDGAARIRCNVSSWYVDPEFRSYASLFAGLALKYKNVTVLNVSAAANTRKTVETWKFTKYSSGVFAAIPALSRASNDTSVRVVDGASTPDAPFDPHDRDLLLEHEGYGCKALWCVTPERAYPFVFRSRHIKSLLPCAQLIYCRGIEEFVRFARPIGLHLIARRLQSLVLLDANGPVPGLVGKYEDDKYPKFFWGPNRPRLGDLAYTEMAIFGV